MLAPFTGHRVRLMLAAAIAAVGLAAPAHAHEQQVVDRKGKVIGTLLSTNTVGVRAGGKQFAVKFKMPGFDTFTEIDQSVVITAYYASEDCSGPMYYSDQADGKWKRNLTPSVYDVPSTGVAIGVSKSQVDRNFFSRIDFYYPDGSPVTVAVKSKQILGENATPSQCFGVTPVEDVFWQVKKITLEAAPPFRLK